MRLLHVLPTYFPAMRYGGPIVSVHGLCRALARAGNEVHVFTTNMDGPDNLPVELGRPVSVDGVLVWYFPVPALRRIGWAPEMSNALWKEVPKFDLLHLHSVFGWPIFAAARIARRCNIPYVLSPRGMLVREMIRRKSRWAKSLWIRLVERQNLAAAAAVHVTSLTEQNALRELQFKTRQIVEIPNGVDVPAEGADGVAATGFDTPPELLFLGRVSWKKGLDRLLMALALLPGVRLAIVGNDDEGYASQLKRIAEPSGVADRVQFLPPAYGPEKWRFFRSAQCFVLPSYSENFGNAVLEAMAVGCPVVVTPEVGVADLVAKSGAGLVVDNEPAALAGALRKILGSAETRKAMSEAGKNAVAEKFSWAHIGKDMTSLYRRILDERS